MRKIEIRITDLLGRDEKTSVLTIIVKAMQENGFTFMGNKEADTRTAHLIFNQTKGEK